MRSTFLILLLPLISTAQTAPASKFALISKETFRSWDVPGGVVILVSRDKTLELLTIGRRDEKADVDDQTLFPIASCTKAFTSAMIAKQVADGKLTWDDPVRKHLPDFHLSDPAAEEKVTVRDLLSHRTGLEGHDLLWYRTPWSQQDLVARVSKLPLVKPFRSTMQYQSILYMAAGQLSAKVAGQSWGDLLSREFFQPLGMQHTALTTTEAAKLGTPATGYRRTGDKTVAVKPYIHREPNPAGSIVLRPADLAVWMRFQLNEGTHDGKMRIPAGIFREAHRPQIEIPLQGEAKTLSPTSTKISYGMGWVIQDYRGHPMLGHTGLVDGFRAQILLLPHAGYGIAVLSNLEGTRMNLALCNRIADVLLKLPPRDWDAYYKEVVADQEREESVRKLQIERGREPDRPASLPLSAFAGTYTEPAYGEATIELADDKLLLKWNDWRLALKHYGGNVFQIESDHPKLDGVPLPFALEGEAVKRMKFLGMVFHRKSESK